MLEVRTRATVGGRAARARGIGLLLAEQLVQAGAAGADHALDLELELVLVLHTFAGGGRAKRPAVMFFANSL